MIDYDVMYQQLPGTALEAWGAILPDKIRQQIEGRGHGELQKWLAALERLPSITPSCIDLNSASITIGDRNDCSTTDRQLVEQQLRVLLPWRKGPYNIFGIEIDTEWRSDMKWARVMPHISSLQDKTVLDVGCGSGYHCWRIAGEGAHLVIGIDPTLVYVMQYHALQHYIRSQQVFVLPFSDDNIPAAPQAFDTVFSMGVLYHRRSPIDHLTQLWELLKEGGELVLETLVIDGEQGRILMPEARYAKMRNVWFIPSCDTLSLWLRRCNFEAIRCVDINQTTTDEQRATNWMHFESLADFLDPEDHNRTVEGYPAPKRAIFTAHKPKKSVKN
ncbi:MAG: tRNA 5-methoxyuridine(34)/uridine 5-oxyacetic acid(34) synthase CmoB [Gammaproteobacteria bacterium]|nr:tRNA 5-methoxyuridine(34)/uridine 5-oxyacetic acid(34) synthase CmoB [Gammaproteobacteria bacterium]